MNAKRSIVISRKWNNPEIEVGVFTTGIGITMKMADYELALAKELGLPLEKVKQASGKVCLEMKSATAQTMAQK